MLALQRAVGAGSRTYRRKIFAQFNQLPCEAPKRLTYEGHEFLDAARNDTLWVKAKETVTKNTGSETGLYYYRARYYDATAGRFLNEDPTRFGGGDNFYLYAENDPATMVDPFGLDSSTWSGLKDLGCWMIGGNCSKNSHVNDSVTGDLALSPAMDDIRNKIKQKNCTPGRYCGQFEYKQVFRPHNFNLVIQTVGSFCADISFSGGYMNVDAFNEWGFQSGTRIPGTNYFSPSLQDMIFNGAKKGIPSSVLNNTHRGPMKVQRFWYHWKEPSPCCGH